MHFYRKIHTYTIKKCLRDKTNGDNCLFMSTFWIKTNFYQKPKKKKNILTKASDIFICEKKNSSLASEFMGREGIAFLGAEKEKVVKIS